MPTANKHHDHVIQALSCSQSSAVLIGRLLLLLLLRTVTNTLTPQPTHHDDVIQALPCSQVLSCGHGQDAAAADALACSNARSMLRQRCHNVGQACTDNKTNHE
jgi:hypothetical protein